MPVLPAFFNIIKDEESVFDFASKLLKQTSELFKNKIEHKIFKIEFFSPVYVLVFNINHFKKM